MLKPWVFAGANKVGEEYRSKCRGSGCHPVDRGKFGGKRHHDDVCGTPVTWVTTCGWVVLSRIREDVGAMRPGSMRAGTRGGNGAKR